MISFCRGKYMKLKIDRLKWKFLVTGIAFTTLFKKCAGKFLKQVTLSLMLLLLQLVFSMASAKLAFVSFIDSGVKYLIAFPLSIITLWNNPAHGKVNTKLMWKINVGTSISEQEPEITFALRRNSM